MANYYNQYQNPPSFYGSGGGGPPNPRKRRFEEGSYGHGQGADVGTGGHGHSHGGGDGGHAGSQPRSDTNLIINYLPQTFSDDELRALFMSYGEIDNCRVMRDRNVRVSYYFYEYMNSKV